MFPHEQLAKLAGRQDELDLGHLPLVTRCRKPLAPQREAAVPGRVGGTKTAAR